MKPINLETDDLELYIWECEQEIKENERWAPSKKRRAFDPCKERLFKRRTRSWGAGWIEAPCYRKEWQRHIRAKFRHVDEESYHPTTHEYWTHGRLTW